MMVEGGIKNNNCQVIRNLRMFLYLEKKVMNMVHATIGITLSSQNRHRVSRAKL